MPERANEALVAAPILVQDDYLIASVQASLSDSDLVKLRDRINTMVTTRRSAGVVLDMSGLDVMDSFAVHTVQTIARMVSLRGAVTVIVGIRSDVAFAMVQWGLSLAPIATALDLDSGLEYLRRVAAQRGPERRTRTSRA